MSQINEGDLQAYLDGAYEVLTPEQLGEIERLIEEDEAFAAQVEEARATRAAASRILGDAVPKEFAPPPFEELQRRAAAAPTTEKPEKRRWIGLPPLVGMGWAATVVLALGVGWFVGQGAGGVPFSNFNDAEFRTPPAQADLESNAEPREERSTLGAAEPGADADASNEVLGDEDDAPLDLAGRTPAQVDAEAAEKKADEGLATGFTEGPPAETPATVTLDEVVATGRRDAVADRARANQEAGAGEAVREQAAPPAAPAGAQPVPDSAAQVIAEDEAQARRLDQRTADERVEFQSDRPAVAEADQAANLEAARSSDALLRASEEEHAYHSLALPGLEVLSVTLDEAGALSGLVILHQLPAGDTLELRYVGLFSQTADPRGGGGLGDRVETETLPALSAQLREAALAPGWRQVVVRKENRWVVARAPISEAQIRAYLMTLN